MSLPRASKSPSFIRFRQRNSSSVVRGFRNDCMEHSIIDLFTQYMPKGLYMCVVFHKRTKCFPWNGMRILHDSAFCVIGNLEEFPMTQKAPVAKATSANSSNYFIYASSCTAGAIE